MGKILETANVTYSYNQRQERPSLEDVTMCITEGARTAILGPNGAGKSTLFYHLNGIYKPTSGTVLHNGRPLEYTKEALRELRSEVSVVVQNPDEQIFSSTVEEDVAFGPMNMDLEHDEVERRIRDSLFKVGMTEYRGRPTTQLSYGQRKRVSLAGALAVDPRVLILDEPTAGLDTAMSHEVVELANQMHESGTTVVISTHDVDLAYSWADEIVVLDNGRLAFSGDPGDFFADRDLVHRTGLSVPRAFAVASSLSGGHPEKPYPRTAGQLLARTLPRGSPKGTVRVRPVSAGAPSAGGSVGAYGFDAKKTLADLGVRPEFTFDAVDGCLIEALSGRDAVLFCDDGLVESVRRTLSESGVVPEVIG